MWSRQSETALMTNDTFLCIHAEEDAKSRVTEPESVSNVHTLEIECWEVPIPSRADGSSPQELLDDFTAVFERGDTS